MHPLDLRQRPEGQHVIQVDGDDDAVSEYLHIAFGGVHRVEEGADHAVPGENDGDRVAGRMQDEVAPFELERHEDHPVGHPQAQRRHEDRQAARAEQRLLGVPRNTLLRAERGRSGVETVAS